MFINIVNAIALQNYNTENLAIVNFLMKVLKKSVFDLECDFEMFQWTGDLILIKQISRNSNLSYIKNSYKEFSI